MKIIGDNKELSQDEFNKKKKVTNVDFRDKHFFEDLQNISSPNNEKIMYLF